MTIQHVRLFVENEQGATAIEYAMIGALISVLLITALGEIGAHLSGTFASVNGGLEGETPSMAAQGMQNNPGG